MALQTSAAVSVILGALLWLCALGPWWKIGARVNLRMTCLSLGAGLVLGGILLAPEILTP